MRQWFLIGLCAGCAEPTEGRWLQGFGFDWNLANHRLSTLHARPVADGLEVAVVGGASTTGVVFDDDGDCIDFDTCTELPFRDASLVVAREVLVGGRRVELAHGTARLVVGPDGATGALEVPLVRRARGATVAVIGGLVVDASPEQALLTCYDPRHGWHFRELGITLGAPEVDGRDVVVPLDASFLAGDSLEESRACVDATNEVASIALEVDVTVITGLDDAEEVTIAQQASWACDDCPTGSPPAQEVPSPVADAALESPLAGWRSLRWRFHTEEATRGAYLRSLVFDLDPDAGTGAGVATNYSPITQLSGFDFAFEGIAVVPRGELDAEARTYSAEALPAALDPVSGEPVLTVLAADP